jgi:hypothetical protein
VRTPALKDLTDDQRADLRAVYATLPALHHLTFDECLTETSIRICLWNVACARRKTRARLAAAVQVFQLTP